MKKWTGILLAFVLLSMAAGCVANGQPASLSAQELSVAASVEAPRTLTLESTLFASLAPVEELIPESGAATPGEPPIFTPESVPDGSFAS